MTSEEARALAVEAYPDHTDLATDLILTSVHAHDKSERSRAGAALAQLREVKVASLPTLPAPDATLKGRTERRLARATALMFSTVELRRWAAPFQDAELERALGVAHGRLLAHIMSARKTLENCR